jgi:hypothetical protein
VPWEYIKEVDVINGWWYRDAVFAKEKPETNSARI